MADPPIIPILGWTLVMILAALCLALVVGTQVVTSYSTAYMAAPHEMVAFLDAVDFSVQENESYDRDVARVPRLEDKMRLGSLLREIQKGGDDLREHLNRLLLREDGTVLKTGARVLWAGHRKELEERVRRLDLLRMRFLVVYMGILATAAGEREKAAEKMTTTTTHRGVGGAEAGGRKEGRTPGLPLGLAEAIRKPALRRLTTSALGHSEKTAAPHRAGWAGVVQELQKSPRMHQRHASVEQSMRSSALRSPPPSPVGSSPPRFRRDLTHSPERTPEASPDSSATIMMHEQPDG